MNDKPYIPSLLLLREIVKNTIGFDELSKLTNLSRTSLYKALSHNGNPTLHTLFLITNALNIVIKVEVV